MFTKSISAGIASLALLAPLTLPATAPAQVPVVVPGPVAYRHHYFVEFRPAPFTPWQVMGPFRSHERAHFVARDLRAQGFHVRIVRG